MDALAKVCPKCRRRYDVGAAFCQTDGVRLQLTDERVDPYIGQTLLDQFKIEEKIGAGGMGTVYRARQTTLHRDVAIKILHPELADNRDAVRRFKREARVCTALDHPNVVRVFLFGQLKDGSLYIVMEYLRGRSLLDVVTADGALPVHRALHIATQICDGVGEAHGQGVVHRDLKPENVVLVQRARDADVVKVLDFGIARVLWGDDQTQATQSGLVFGTARYISPEGAAGESTDARSDVYSLGIIAYQLLSGRTPFDARSPVAMLMKHIHSTPPHLLSHEDAAHVPSPVADVVMRALSKNPEGRYDDAHALADALRAAAQGAGFEVRGLRPTHSSIGPISEPPVAPKRRRSEGEPTPRMREASPTPPMGPPPSETLAGAPNPFGDPFDDHEDVSIPGLGPPVVGPPSRIGRTIAIAFAIGALLAGGGFAIHEVMNAPPERPEVDVDGLAEQARAALVAERYDETTGSVRALTDRILAERPGHPEATRLRQEAATRLARRAEGAARDEARALYERALRLQPGDEAITAALAALDAPPAPRVTPGVRTRPTLVIAGRTVTLEAGLAEGETVPDGGRPRFVIQRNRRSIGSSIEASPEEGGRSFQAEHRFGRAGTYEVVFRAGSGADRIEHRATVEVARDPDRPARPSSDEGDPPPITTQGSTWSPPTIAPAWAPTQANPLPAAPLPAAANPPPAQPAPPPPPAPWTSGGSVL